MYGLQVATAATTTPVTLDEVKAHLRVDSTTTEDTYIGTLIAASIRHIEQREDRTLVNTVYRMTLDEFPCDSSEAIRVPRPPLQSVTSITYTNSTGGSSTWASSDYIVDAESTPGRILPAFGQAYPSPRDIENAITITYQAGYGGTTASTSQSAAAVPATYKHAVKLLVSHWFENREPVNIGNIANALPMTVEALLSSESVGRYP